MHLKPAISHGRWGGPLWSSSHGATNGARVGAFVALAILSAALIGCASASKSDSGGTAPIASDPAGTVPTDLWLELRVVPGSAVEDRVKIEERPARFVVLPDGSLHGEADRVPPDGIRPARIRRLAREQMADVWSTLTSLGFAEKSLSDVSGTPRLVEPARDEIVVTAEVHANGERLVFVRRYKPDSNDELAMRKLVRSIASLAWASDEALAESAELPLRYDLGPDPYARFTQPKAQSGGKP
jgi:hypothetical protein